jgi:hypothetical protein
MVEFDNWNGRKETERQVNADLNKSYRHLLTDIHEELLYNELYKEELLALGREPRTIDENILHSQKRFASLQVKIALQMRWLMAASVIFSIIAVIIAWIALAESGSLTP